MGDIYSNGALKRSYNSFARNIGGLVSYANSEVKSHNVDPTANITNATDDPIDVVNSSLSLTIYAMLFA